MADRIMHLDEGQRRPRKSQLDAAELLEYAKRMPNGFTADDAAERFGWDVYYVNTVVRELRRQLGENDSMNLPCSPQGQGERWLYRLVGNMDDARDWTANRTDDMESRFKTMVAMTTAMGRSPGGSEIERRKARKIAKTLEYLLGELADLA